MYDLLVFESVEKGCCRYNNPPGIEGESPECRKRSNSGRGLGPKSPPVAAKSSEKLRENGYRNQPTFLNLKQA